MSTISMVLNDRRDISIPEKTRRAVKAVAKEMGYLPKTRSRLNKAIAVLTLEDLRTCFENPYFAEIFSSIETTMERMGFHAIIKRLRPDEPLGEIEVLKRSKIDGVLVLGSPPAACFEELKKTGLPVVFVNATVDSSWDSVIPDFQASFEHALEILREQGHRKILCLKSAYSDEKTPYVSEYLTRAIKFTGFSPKQVIMVRVSDDSSETAYQTMKKYLAETPRLGFTAAFSGRSKPFGMLRALREAGIKVPEEVSLIAIGGVPFKADTADQLSTVHYPLRQVGQEGVLRLVQKAQGLAPSPCKIVLPVTYEDHGTVAKAPRLA